MVLEKIRKSESTITGLVISLLLVVGIFIGGYLYLSNNYTSAGITVSDDYVGTYSRLNTSQNDLESLSSSMRGNYTNIVEADSVYQVAINGFKGLGNVLKIPVLLIDLAINTFESFLDLISVIPGWVIALVSIGITLYVILLLVKMSAGGTNSI